MRNSCKIANYPNNIQESATFTRQELFHHSILQSRSDCHYHKKGEFLSGMPDKNSRLRKKCLHHRMFLFLQYFHFRKQLPLEDFHRQKQKFLFPSYQEYPPFVSFLLIDK